MFNWLATFMIGLFLVLAVEYAIYGWQQWRKRQKRR